MATNSVDAPGGPTVVLFGGRGAAPYDNDTWTWDSGVHPVPVVTGIAPATGSTAGGTVVTVSGSKFATADKVQFGADPTAAVACPSATCSIVDPSTILVTTPAHAAAIVHVVVFTPFEFSAQSDADRFTFTQPVQLPPAVNGVLPKSGPAAGGEQVTITGSNLARATAVRFGPDLAAAVPCPGPACSLVNPSQLSVITPAHAPGPVHVVVESPDGSSQPVDADIYRFDDPPVVTPTLTAVDPPTGSVDGGDAVVVRGTALAAVTKVRFGPAEDGASVDCPSTNCTLGGDGQVDVITPPHAAATVHVTVLTTSRTSVANDDAVFTFAPSGDGGGFQDSGQGGLAEPPSQTPFQAAPPGGSPVGSPSPGIVISPGIAIGATPGGSPSAAPVNPPNPSATPPPVHPVPGVPAGSGYASPAAAPDAGRAGPESAPYFPMVGDPDPFPFALGGLAAVAGFACFSLSAARRRKPKPRPAYRGAY